MAARGLLALLLLLLPLADAAVSGDFDVKGEVLFTGSADGGVAWVGSLHDARLHHPPAFQPVQADGEAEVLTYRYAFYEWSRDSPVGYDKRGDLLSSDPQPLGAWHGPVRFGAAGSFPSLRLLPGSAVPAPLSGDFSLNASRDLRDLLRRDDAQPFEDSAVTYPPAGGVLGRHPLRADQPFSGTLVATDYLLEGPGGEVDTRWSTEEAPVPGMGRVFVLTTRVLVIHGTLAVHPALDPADWVNVVESVDARLDGDLFLPNAQGEGVVNGTPLPSGVHMLQAMGPMEAHADYRVQGSRWHLDGDPRFLAVNTFPVVGSRPGAVALVAGAGLLALALAAAAKALRALGHAVPGLSRAEPFGNETRVGILEFVTANPGVTVPVVAGRFQVGRATARHHLAVLERNQLVSCVRSGGATFYTLNHETFMFPVGGAGTPTAGEAFHQFVHPARQQVRQALEALGAASYPEMADFWRANGEAVLAPDLVSYHCHKLLDLGLLAREPDGKAVRWRLAHRLDEALRHQRQAFLKHGGLGRLLDALAEGPATVDQVARRLHARGHRMARTAIRGGLRLLAATGYVEDTAAGWKAMARPA